MMKTNSRFLIKQNNKTNSILKMKKFKKFKKVRKKDRIYIFLRFNQIKVKLTKTKINLLKQSAQKGLANKKKK